jgi:hypothetical protein
MALEVVLKRSSQSENSLYLGSGGMLFLRFVQKPHYPPPLFSKYNLKMVEELNFTGI